MQRLDFELDGGVVSETVKNAKGEDVETRRHVSVKGRVVVGERDIAVEVDGKGCVALVTLQEMLDAPAAEPEIVPVPPPVAVDETDAERLAREKNEREAAEAEASAEKSGAELKAHNAKVTAEREEAERKRKR
jgi:hypothetical protein